MSKQYIKEWYEAETAETRNGEHGIVHICTNDLLQGDENEKQKEYIGELVYDILYRQHIKEQQTREFSLLK